MDRNKGCKACVQEAWEDRKKDLEAFMEAEDYEDAGEELGSLYDYGLSIDRVEAGTFDDQRAPFTRWLFSWGGPQEELRFFDNGDIEFWFLDWFDGACVDVTHDPVAEWAKDWACEAVQC